MARHSSSLIDASTTNKANVENTTIAIVNTLRRGLLFTYIDQQYPHVIFPPIN